MLKIVYDKTFNNGSKSLKVQKLACEACGSNYIKSAIKYGNGNYSNYLSNINLNSTECKVCNNHEYDLNDYAKDANELAKIIKNTETNNTATKLRCKQYTNKQVTPLWSINFEIGKIETNRYGNVQLIPSRYAVSCTKCGHVKMISAEEDKELSQTVCNKCKQYLVTKVLEKYNEILSKLKPEIDELIKSEQQKENKTEQENVKEVEQKSADAFSKMKKRFSKYNPNMNMLAAYKVEDLETTLICCKLCGTPKEISSHRIKDLKDYECAGCKAQIENPNYLGLYKRDITNTTKNGLVCESQDGDKVTLRCKYCGTIYRDKDKVRFLLGKITCTKKETCSSVDVLCPECYYSIPLKNKDIVSSEASKIICPKCNTNVYTDAINEITAMDKKVEISEGLRYLSSQTQKPVEFQNGMARTFDSLYRGDDGNDYYNCRCTIHNQSCILSDKEIDIEPHKYCNNIHNIFIDELNIKNLKLNRESSITERSEK